MNNATATAATLAALCLAAISCGPSANELRLQNEADELHKDVAEQKQYNADLKLRIGLVDARNRVLIDLVKGLTRNAEPDAQSQPQATLLPAHASLQALDKDMETLIASVQHSREDMDAVRAQRQALADQLASAKHTIEDSRADETRSDARVAAFRNMLAQLAPLIERGDVDVRILKGRMLLELPEHVLFESNDGDLTVAGKSVLERVAQVLQMVGERDFQIGGHTDGATGRRGRFSGKWQLSAVRALNVMLYLIDRGVPKARLSTAAYGDTQEIADDATAEGRAANRRIEIVLLPNLDELPDLSALADLLKQPAPAASPPPP
jgi:chemotaxis protein MotB